MMKIHTIFWFIVLILLLFLFGCNKEDNDKLKIENSDIDKSIKFTVLWEKEINYSSFDAIFFEKYFILPNSIYDIDIYSKETGEHIAKLDEGMVTNFVISDLSIVDDKLYAYSYDNYRFYEYNLISKELKNSDSVTFVYDFLIDNNDIYYSTDFGIYKTDFKNTYQDTLFEYKTDKLDFSTSVNFIEMRMYKSELENEKYLVISYMEEKNYKPNKFNLLALDLFNERFEFDKSFNMNDFLYKLKIIGDNLCVSSYQMVYIYSFSDKKYYLENSNHTININRNVHLLEKTNSNWDKRVYYYNVLEYNSYNFHNGDIEWTIKNRYIKDVSSIKLKDNYYLSLLKENSLYIIDSYSGKIKANFEYKPEGKTKYFRECSSVFNGNEVILRQGNSRILKVAINKF